MPWVWPQKKKKKKKKKKTKKLLSRSEYQLPIKPTLGHRALWSSLVAQWVKDHALTPQWLRSLLWHGFNPWPKNFCMPWARPKKKKKKNAHLFHWRYELTPNCNICWENKALWNMIYSRVSPPWYYWHLGLDNCCCRGLSYTLCDV